MCERVSGERCDGEGCKRCALRHAPRVFTMGPMHGRACRGSGAGEGQGERRPCRIVARYGEPCFDESAYQYSGGISTQGAYSDQAAVRRALAAACVRVRVHALTCRAVLRGMLCGACSRGMERGCCERVPCCAGLGRVVVLVGPEEGRRVHVAAVKACLRAHALGAGGRALRGPQLWAAPRLRFSLL